MKNSWISRPSSRGCNIDRPKNLAKSVTVELLDRESQKAKVKKRINLIAVELIWVAVPLSETDVRISWGRPGDDGKSGIFILTRGFLNKYSNKNVLRNIFTAQTTG